MKAYIYPFLLLFFLLGCSKPQKKSVNGAFAKEEQAENAGMDLNNIKETGELIVGTMSGPDTYFDYQGVPLGREYSLASAFASSEGVRIRVELAHDEQELMQMLREGNIDLIAYPLSKNEIAQNDLRSLQREGDTTRTSWAVRPQAEELAEAILAWYGHVNMKQLRQSMPHVGAPVRRQVRAPFLSRERGIISPYDNEFKAASRIAGWDWKLLAAQCYQESGFDPHAVSWAGAQGLMQMMPATAASMGLQNAMDPQQNIAAAARYIRHLNGNFADIRNPEERIRFVLGAYNGGTGHIRDAMALARKYGKNPSSWNDVSQYVLALQNVKYYRDPVVRYGYMIGSETANYVSSVLMRWRMYGGTVGNISASSMPMDGNIMGTSSNKKGKHKIFSPDDPEFNQMEE